MNQNSLDSLLNGDLYYASNHTFRATIQYEATGINSTLSHVGIRLRGNTSLTAPKKSFKLDLAIGDSRLNVDPLNVDTKYLAELL